MKRFQTVTKEHRSSVKRIPHPVGPATGDPHSLRQQGSGPMAPGRIPFCPCDGHCPTCSPPIQGKLKIGEPDDEYELEADRMADRVMRMPVTPSHPQDPDTTVGGTPGQEEELVQSKFLPGMESSVLQRQYVPEEEEEEEEMLQPKFLPKFLPGMESPLLQRQSIDDEEEEEELQMKPFLGTSGPLLSPPPGISIPSTGGEPLSRDLRSYFEPRFRRNFETVRIHRDHRAALAADALHARAFTSSRNISFGSGQYSPETFEGRRLMAHELTHVIQQSGDGPLRTGDGAGKGRTRMTDPGPAPDPGTVQRELLSEDADRLARRVRELFLARERSYGDLDAILVNRGMEDVHQIFQQYEEIFGRGSFNRSLTRFVSTIPGHEGQSPEDVQEMRDGMWDRYAAHLYDAGVPSIQVDYHTPRPVPITPANERQWIRYWREHFDRNRGTESETMRTLLSRWILQRWVRIRTVEQIRRRGWMPPLNSDEYRASFGVLSHHVTVRENGIRSGLDYWNSITDRFENDFRATITRATSYHESYVNAHYTLNPLIWDPTAQPPPMRESLPLAIHDWHHINSRGRLPGDVGGLISHWMEVLRHWNNNLFVPSWLRTRAGFSSNPEQRTLGHIFFGRPL